MLAPILFTCVIVLHQAPLTTQLYDCNDLKEICRADPGCGDETLFLTKCKRRAVQYLSVPFIKRGGRALAYNDGDEVRHVYAEYDREALRESLYLLKQKLHQQNIDVIDDDDDAQRQQQQRQQQQQERELVVGRNAGKHLRDALVRRYLRYRHSGGVPGSSDEEEERKRDVIDKAFDLVQILIRQRETGAQTQLHQESNEEKTTSDQESKDEVKTTEKRELESTVSENDRESDDEKDVVVNNDDNFEVATPVYTESDDLEEAEDNNKNSNKDNTDNNSSNNDSTNNNNENNSNSNSDSTNNNDEHNQHHAQRNEEVRQNKQDSKVGNKTTTGSVQHIDALNAVPPPVVKPKKHWDRVTLFSIIVAASVLLLLSVAIGVIVVKRKGSEFPPLHFRKTEAMEDYKELCRTKMSIVNSPHPEEGTDKQQLSKAWGEEGSPYNMDITTGHVILSYMETHLHDAERLNKEWEALCAYKADDCSTSVGSDAKYGTKNRYRDILPFDNNRVVLQQATNAFHCDYINASSICDSHPRSPAYIATQGPLDNTVQDFWQLVWEQGVVVIINLTKLSDMGLPQCHQYWPKDGSQTYHIYEVHLISEHIWCDDYLVRSLYLKNLNTCETRTVTQFHYLTWSHLNSPQSPTPLLEFRRKVNRCYRGSQCPVLVHCNNGIGRTGTYILLDMVLNRMLKGVKEIDIAAALEHLRDQRQGMVKTKQQFEFVLLATAQEVSTILDAVATN